ncbi:MAG: zinc-dependent metalloprotease [Nocardioides sp.]
MSVAVDWDLAVSVGSRMAGDGPATNRDQAAAVVAELRAGASRSVGLVGEFTGLDAGERIAPVLVVNRAGWIQANADGFARLLDPLVAKLLARSAEAGATGAATPQAVGAESADHAESAHEPSARDSSADSGAQRAGRAVGAKVAGAQLGLMFGFLGSKVLGQFDPFADPVGRLLLVAPNIVHVERELGAVPADFRLWVCLHEETHRVQFTAVPWMRGHIFAEMAALVDSLDSSSVFDEGLKRVSAGLRERFRAGDSRPARSVPGSGGSLAELLRSPEQAAILDRLTGVMSLLEGHADVVMDGVGPSVIGTVREIRARFDERRTGAGSVDRLVRRLLGLDAKMAQYRDGAKFVRAVVAKVGMADFNAIWASPEQLPSTAEIHDPAAWITRVHR